MQNITELIQLIVKQIQALILFQAQLQKTITELRKF